MHSVVFIRSFVFTIGLHFFALAKGAQRSNVVLKRALSCVFAFKRLLVQKPNKSLSWILPAQTSDLAVVCLYGLFKGVLKVGLLLLGKTQLAQTLGES